MSGFVAFSAADFSAYEPKKWGSNAYTLERIRVKEKFQQLSTALAAALPDVTAHLSDEFPNIVNGKKVDAQWLYFSRSPEATQALARFLEKTELKPDKIFQLAPQDKHAILAVVMDETRVRAGLWAHAGAWVDRRNLAAKLIHPWEREKLKNALVDAPELLGFEGETYPAAEWSLEALEALAVHLPDDERRFLLLREWSAEEAIALGAGLSANLEAVLRQARATYDFATWSRDNDEIAVGEKIRKEKAEQRKNATGLRGGDRVRITGGLFAGKVGVVQGVDTKANVKVLVGAMAVTVAGTDLSPVG